MLTGSCVCNAVRFEIDNDVDHMSHCHCSMCRKVHGAAFGTYVSTKNDEFRFVCGEDRIRRYESSPGFNRGFCDTCGSVLPDSVDGDHVSIAAGTLNEDLGEREQSHIFVRDKVPWLVLDEALPRYDTYSPAYDGPAIDSPKRPLSEDALSGSCLCGAVGYEIRGPFRAAYNCHCSRCRKARGSAHASNGFCDVDDAVFTRGEENVETFRLAEAKRFGVAFCRTCGSGVLRRVPDAGVGVVPLAALDKHPIEGPGSHIFVDSKADWYRIPDDLPRHDAAPPV